MPDVPEPQAQHPRLAEQLRRAFGLRIPDNAAFQRFVELLDRDYADTGAPGAPDVGATDCSGGVLWRFRKSSEGFRHTWCRGQLLRRLGLFAEEIEGRTLFDFLPKTAAEILVPYYLRAWTGESFAVEVDLAEFGLGLLLQFQPVFLDGFVHEVLMTGLERAPRAVGGNPFLESVLQHTYECVMVTNGDLEAPGPAIVYVNRAFTELTGYAAEDVIGKSPRILQGPKSDREALARLSEALHDGHSFTGHLVNYRKDRTEYHVECSIAPLRDPHGAVTHWISVQRDVSEQQRVAEALKESEARYRSVIDSIREVVFQTDLEGRWTFLNPAWEEITGFSVKETIGMPLFNSIHPEDRLRNDALLRPVAEHRPGFAR
jgi:PAS domain S-box-containing protein